MFVNCGLVIMLKEAGVVSDYPPTGCTAPFLLFRFLDQKKYGMLLEIRLK
jgi:hypothetical protein